MSIGKHIMAVLYNLDRTVASLFGAPRQETISSELGRHESDPVDKAAAEVLDAVVPEHVENSVKNADSLDKADLFPNE